MCFLIAMSFRKFLYCSLSKISLNREPLDLGGSSNAVSLMGSGAKKSKSIINKQYNNSHTQQNQLILHRVEKE